MRQKIACIIPSYNHAKFIAEAIRSVICQTLPPERLVIVDDGSLDNSVDLVRAFTDSRIQLVQQENQGAHVALTRGLELSKDCGFISVLNSDDRYHPERFARCAAFLERHPGADLVCTRVRLIDEFGIPVGHRDGRQRRIDRIWLKLRKTNDLAGSLGYGNFTKTTSNFFFRAGAIAAFHPYRFVHDYFAALTVGLRGALGLIHQDLLDYRVHAANTIKAEGKGAVVQELIQMHLDLLADLRPGLETDPLLRKRVLSYLKIAFNNYTDMRAELLVLSIARLLTEEGNPTEKLKEFPEIAEPSTPPP
jgi:glycosyltransferase involved in cell wall biosynthesis